MKLRIIIVVLVTALLAACSSSDETKNAAYNDSAITTESRQNDTTKKYLAYEHRVTIDASEEILESLYNDVVMFCVSDKVNACIILDSNLNTGKDMSANIRIRIKSQGVKLVVAVATTEGEVVNQSTHVEDLAKPIIDNKRRLKMLQAYQTKLVELETKAVNDIDALIKISSELSRIQSQLEQASGNKAHFLLRTNMDILNIKYVVIKNRTFWSPVSRSLSTYSRNLSEGISQAITATAYILPWLVVIVFISYFFRFLWRRGKKA